MKKLKKLTDLLNKFNIYYKIEIINKNEIIIYFDYHESISTIKIEFNIYNIIIDDSFEVIEFKKINKMLTKI